MSGQRRFEFALTTEADDGELRALLRHISMPGNITLAFLREPSFFLAEQAGSAASQVIICKDRQKGQLVGIGSRSIRCVYIDGKPASVGYLSYQFAPVYTPQDMLGQSNLLPAFSWENLYVYRENGQDSGVLLPETNRPVHVEIATL